MKNYFFLLVAAFLTVHVSLFAQDRKDKTAVTYEELYDEPYSVNKLFVSFQPLYGELFVTNVNAGFGLEGAYYYQDKAHFNVSFRKTYSQHFFDFSRDLAVNNSDVDNREQVFRYFEAGGTYHVRDFEQSSKTRMFLYKNSYRGNKWASRVPLHAEVPCKVRKIYGVRVGGITWASTTDLGRALEAQELKNSDLKSGDNSLPETYFNAETGKNERVNVFSNINSTSVYLGGSLSWIKNVAVNFDKFEEGVDDLMLTTYFDIMYAPLLTLDDVVYTSASTGTNVYSVEAVKLNKLGFRLGIDGRFNRTLSWGYGGEIGYRPSLKGRGFFMQLKISFPMYGTNLDYKVESFGK